MPPYIRNLPIMRETRNHRLPRYAAQLYADAQWDKKKCPEGKMPRTSGNSLPGGLRERQLPTNAFYDASVGAVYGAGPQRSTQRIARHDIQALWSHNVVRHRRQIDVSSACGLTVCNGWLLTVGAG